MIIDNGKQEIDKWNMEYDDRDGIIEYLSTVALVQAIRRRYKTI